MGIGELGFAVAADIARSIHQSDHSLSQRFRPRHLGIISLSLEQTSDEVLGRLRMD
jgi:hypothetical protein